jgi:Flp pilus assembly protein TadB
MTVVVVLATLTALGALGVVRGLRPSNTPLEVVWADWQRPADSRRPSGGERTPIDGLATEAVRQLAAGRWSGTPRARALRSALAVTETDPRVFASRLVVTVGVAALAPVALWLVLQVLGVGLPIGAAVVGVCIGPALGVAIPVSGLVRRGSERRRHVRVVLGSFVDLVVLSLAGGVGIDGALHSASRVTPDWAARRMARALGTARDAGATPWGALAELGEELDVPELVELSTTVQLAGTEGARIRQSLTARGASLRRHEQAEAESAANAMTERLFLPGALLLLGFLVFIGYPAIHRILGGF